MGEQLLKNVRKWEKVQFVDNQLLTRMQSNRNSHVLLVGKQKWYAAAKSLQSCPTLCDPIDSSPPGSPAPGILQAKTLEWVAIYKWHSTLEKFGSSF